MKKLVLSVQLIAIAVLACSLVLAGSTGNASKAKVGSEALEYELQVASAGTVRNIAPGPVLYTNENGKQFQLENLSTGKIKLEANKIKAETALEVVPVGVLKKTRLEVKLSNGKNTEIKVMPDVASEKALEKFKLKVCSEENNCTIELKETGNGENSKPVYEVQMDRDAKVFLLFKTKMHVMAQVDAENGELVAVKKPWWAFLASEPKEE